MLNLNTEILKTEDDSQVSRRYPQIRGKYWRAGREMEYVLNTRSNGCSIL